MKVIRLSLENNVSIKDELSLCIGYFDGLHIGHQSLINKAMDYAKENGMKSGLITFDPDPITVIKNLEEPKQHLYRLEDRIELGRLMGLDYWFILDFTPKMMNLQPKEFVDKILGNLNLKYIVCGQDFRFGSRGKGDGLSLRELGKGKFDVSILELIQLKDEKISSSRIIKALEEGDIECVTRLLGRPYHLQGPVIGGNQQGQKIGFPTANVYVDDEYVLPKQGVYIAIAKVRGQLYPVMINVGHNLTFNTRVHLSIEGYILDFSEQIYGEFIQFHFLKYLRPELKFDSVEALVDRMKVDKLETRAYFESKQLSKLLPLSE